MTKTPHGSLDLVRRTGRRPAVLAALLGNLALALVLYIWLEASLWVVIALGAVSLPALWDFLSARPSVLRVEDGALIWRSGTRHDHIPLNQIARLRLERRLDLSLRVRLILTDGRRLTLPPDCTPRAAALEAALTDTDITVERSSFSFV